MKCINFEKKNMSNTRIKMYHPWKRNSDGTPKIQTINKKTVDSGKAAMLGYTKVIEAEKPPVLAPATKGKITSAPVVKGGELI